MTLQLHVNSDRSLTAAEQVMMIMDSAAAVTSDMVQRWQEFAHRLSSDHGPDQRDVSDERGELLVLGSGLAHADLLINDEELIRSADYVFHCLYDRVTQIWISGLRPDAFDLRILYSPGLARHDSYICMAEAMLHHVRRGKRVVAVFYGHPGIFATPTHRAVKIAKNEGHRALMRPGISALDHLIADVGFDPMIPGLLSYEASDMLLRRRRLDASLHTVLWQVGAVGEFSYDPQGFVNSGFDLLVQELKASYGSDWEVVNYIAPQYAGVEPLIERHPIGALDQTEVRSRVSAMSTFYIAPQRLVATDRDRASELGFPTQHAPAGMQEQAYDLASYGELERMALLHLSGFVPPTQYAAPGPSPAADFMLALSREPELLSRFRADAAEVLASSRFSNLSDRARQLLMIPHPLAINAAIAEPPSSSEPTSA